jgi:hypothetical protein
MSNDDDTRDGEPTESPVGEVRTGKTTTIGRRAYLLAGLAVTTLAEVTTTLTDTGISGGTSHSSGLGG